MKAIHEALKRHLAKMKQPMPADEVDEDREMEGKMGKSDRAPDINDAPSPLESHDHMDGVGEIGPEHHAIMEKMLLSNPTQHTGRSAMSLDERAHEKMASIMKHKKAAGGMPSGHGY